VYINDRPGAVDRVIGLFRRRRARMQTLVLGPADRQDVVRVSVVVNDSEVAVDHVVEQLRKVVDVREAVSLVAEQAISRELALIKVGGTSENLSSIVELGNQYGATVVDSTTDTVILEVAGSAEKIDKLISQLRAYTIHEIARSGSVAIARGTGA
jgi:acetolactate synthase-1/3 small subunit